MCGQSGVGPIAYVDVHVAGSDSWQLAHMQINNDLEVVNIAGSNELILTTRRFYA